MFGSDWPVCELAGSYAEVVEAAERRPRADQRVGAGGDLRRDGRAVLRAEGLIGRPAGDRLEPLADLARARADGLGDFAAVAEEDERRPELDPERPAERLAGPVLDLDVLDLGVVFEQRGDLGRDRPAVAAPGRAELQQDRARSSGRSRPASARLSVKRSAFTVASFRSVRCRNSRAIPARVKRLVVGRLCRPGLNLGRQSRPSLSEGCDSHEPR